MQTLVRSFGPALHNIFLFSCGPMEKIIAQVCRSASKPVEDCFEKNFFAAYGDRKLPTYSSALQPSNDDHLLIQPKKLVNPVLESKNHRTMQNELKLNKKLYGAF